MNYPPLLDEVLFYPRQALASKQPTSTHEDGLIELSDGHTLGFRLYSQPSDRYLVLLFHGNGEIATDYDSLATDYHACASTLMVVDYRGYGWSSGRPTLSTLLSDATDAVHSLISWQKDQPKFQKPIVAKGRSLGCILAIQVAAKFPDLIQGLIIESGFGDVAPLLSRLGINPELLILDPFQNVSKIHSIQQPCLFIHGEQDELTPLTGCQQLYQSCPAQNKTISIIQRAGHNDLIACNSTQYFEAISRFMSSLPASTG